MRSDLAVDVGTSNITVFDRNQGIVINEPLVVCRDVHKQKEISFGLKALDDYSQYSSGDDRRLELVYPMKNGEIDNFEALKYVISRTIKPYSKGLIDRLRTLVCVKSSTTSIGKRELHYLVESAGCYKVDLIESTLAAGLGCDLPVYEPVGTFILDVGAGSMEAGVISLGCVVSTASDKHAVSDIDDEISYIFKKVYNLEISTLTAEKIKVAVAKLDPLKDDSILEVQGTLITDNSFTTVLIEPIEVKKLLEKMADRCVKLINEALINTPGELSQDVLSRGFYLVGRGAKTVGLDDYINREVSIPVTISSSADIASVLGAGKCLEAMDSLKRLFIDPKTYM